MTPSVWVLATRGGVNASIQCWSARSDLWGPGRFVTVDQPGGHLTFASWGSMGQIASNCRLATTQGLGRPGVAEAAILAGAVTELASPVTWISWPLVGRL